MAKEVRSIAAIYSAIANNLYLNVGKLDDPVPDTNLGYEFRQRDLGNELWTARVLGESEPV